MTCLGCNQEFTRPPADVIAAAISGSIMGDEYSDIYYLCPHCGLYTVVQVYEPFLGPEQRTVRGPLDREAGDAAVALIRTCPEPWNKKCRCAAHRTYFRDTLD